MNSLTVTHRRHVAQKLMLFAVLVLALVTDFSRVASAQWTVVARNAIDLGQAGNFNIEELSGITYVGIETGGAYRFATISDGGGIIGLTNVTLSANGSLQSAVAVGSVITADPSFDTEGIAYTNPARNSVFVAYERDKDDNDIIPGVREYSLSTGNVLQSVSLPNVWNVDGNTSSNRGFEALSRMPHAKSMWTGNEEALTIDGDPADENNGTLIRLQKMSVNGNAITANQQFPYLVDPVHSASNPDRSGMPELVGLPDGTLLVLERSSAAAIPAFQNRIYHVDYSNATDVSGSQFDSGLDNGATYTAAAKSLVWSGAVNGFLGNNMEGLALGPQLANGNWSMVGVVDNGGGSNGNYLVGFELIPPSVYGDFDLDADFDCQDVDALVAEIVAATSTASFDLSGDGVVDSADVDEWLADAATANGFADPFLSGDANLDGEVDGLDFAAWNSNRFSANASWCSGDFNVDGVVDVSDFNIWLRNNTSAVAPAAVPEPDSWVLLVMMCVFVRRALLPVAVRN